MHVGEKNQCSYCGGWFTPQGLPTHEAAHMRKENSKLQAEHTQVGE